MLINQPIPTPLWFYRKAIAEDDPDSDFQGSRYVPILKSILEEACNRSLSFHDYPSVLPMPDEAMPSKGGKKKSGGVASSARKSGATSRWSTSGGPSKKTSGPSHLSGPRIIVFVIGGACYSELRVCREVMEREGREVILGSTAFISANEFIEDLSKLNET